MSKRSKGSQQLHDERLGKERERARRRVLVALGTAMNVLPTFEHHRRLLDENLCGHVEALDHHLNAVFQDLLALPKRFPKGMRP